MLYMFVTFEVSQSLASMMPGPTYRVRTKTQAVAVGGATFQSSSTRKSTSVL